MTHPGNKLAVGVEIALQLGIGGVVDDPQDAQVHHLTAQ